MPSIYFMSNTGNTVLYLGVTNELTRRVAEHKAGIAKESFTLRYNCKKLVYFENTESIGDAIAREKQIKNWKRAWKEKLIEGFNPQWLDLSKDIGVDAAYLKAVAFHYNEDCGSSPQ